MKTGKAERRLQSGAVAEGEMIIMKKNKTKTGRKGGSRFTYTTIRLAAFALVILFALTLAPVTHTAGTQNVSLLYVQNGNFKGGLI